VVKALRYKPAGRWFDSRSCHWNFSVTQSFGRTMALGSTQPLTEMSTRCISWGKGGRRVRLTTLPPSCAVIMKSVKLNLLETSGPLQACNGTALHLLEKELTFFLLRKIKVKEKFEKFIERLKNRVFCGVALFCFGK